MKAIVCILVSHSQSGFRMEQLSTLNFFIEGVENTFDQTFWIGR